MAVAARASYPDLLDKTLSKVVSDEYGRFPDEQAEIYQQLTSDESYEKQATISGLGVLPRKDEGQPYTFDVPAEGYTTTWTHLEYGGGFRVTQTMLEDDLFGKMKTMAEGLGEGANQTKQLVAATPFINGFTVAKTDGDKTYLFSGSHPLAKAGGTDSNLLSSAADLDYDSLWQAKLEMEDTVNDAGIPQIIVPAVLWIPPELEPVAIELLQSPGRPDSPNLQTNAVKSMKLTYKIWHFLTDSNAWFLLARKHSLIHFSRTALSTGRDNDPHTGDRLYTARYRDSFNYRDWRGVFGTPGI